MIKTSTLSLVFLIFLGFCPIASALTGGPDGYGYTFTDSTEPGGPSYEWIDISESGTAVLQSGSSTVNGFGISAPVELVSPFTFYGFTFREAVPSANGYLSFTATEDGTDTTNDCGLIVFPSSGSPDRIYVLHDHLDLGTALDDATIYYQHIVNGPHPHNDCPVSIFQWEDITHDGSAVPFSFQLLLFANGDILMQYDNRNPEDGSGSTTGIQYFNGLEYSCDTANSIPSNHAILFTPPTITVTTAVDENGVSPDTGVSLREAIATAPDGARITFSSALNGATILLEELSDGAGGFDPRELLLNDPMTIDASNLPDGITISGQNQTTPFLVRAACHFDNLTITDGFGDISVFTPNYGGGIDIQYFPNETPSSEGSLSLCHCTIIGNNSSKGGIAAEAKPKAINDPPTNILWMNKCTATLNDPAGVEATAAGVFISNSQLSFNTRNGLALFRSNIQGPTPGRCELVMEDSNLVGNAEAGLYCIDATGLTVRRCSLNANLNHGLHAELFTNGVIEDTTFSFNTTSGSGGGALLESSDLVFRRCTFHNNEASSGGAVFSSAPYNQNNASDLEFVNCTFSANTASSDGSAVVYTSTSTSGEQIEFKSCTFADNVGFNTIELGDLGRELADATMRNCVFFNNRNTQGNLDMLSIDPLAVFASLGGNITDETTTELNHPSDQTNIDPLLGPLGTNGGHTKTHALDPASPAIDAGFGSGAVLPSNDQRGFDRVIDGDTDGTATIDSGAYEFVGNLTVTTEIDEVLDPGVGLSLREALTQIGDGGIITISFALNGETTNLVGPSAQSTPLLIDKNITIDASRLGDGFSISGLSQINVMEIDNASVTLQGITLKRGTLSGNGGAGLRVTNDADVTMIDGGVQASESDGNGGGIHIDGSSSLDLLRTNINNNATTLSTGRPGGGIFVGPGGDLSIRNSTVSNNFATSSGGGIHASANSQVTITRSSIIQNECDLDHGGGLYLSLQSNITAENMTLSGNVSNNIGGGIYGANISGSITHSTIADNRSMTNGGGIHLLNGSTLDIGHTILAANTNNSGLRNVDVPLGAITSLGFNLIDGNPSFADPLHDYTKRKPFLAPLALYGGENRTHALLAISPAIDAGDAGITQAPSTDARGFVRIATGKGNPAAFPRIDIGAVEAGNFISVATAVDEFNNTGQVSLREALAQINDGERILFGPALNGATIDISSAGGGQNNPLTIDKTVQIDATTLPDGMEISGGNSRRVLSILAENTVALHALTIRDGSSVGDGAGIRSLADLVITHSCIRDNSSNGDGGGIAAEEGSLRLFNSTVSGNSSGANGGGIALTGSASATFDACTIASNSTSSATLTGGLSLGTANATTYSSIFANNTNSAGSNNFDSSSTLTDHLTSRGFNIADDGGARVFIETGDLQSTNPLLGALNSNNGWSDAHAPGIASPAIDAGDSFLSLVQCYDQRGFTRVAGAAPDIGAFERDGQVDSDSDGMPDYWEDLYGFDSSNPGDAALDANQNGITNLSEFLNGDDPLLFLIVDLAPVGIIAFSRDSANNSMDLTLSTDPGSSYSVLHSTDLRQWSTLFIQTGHLGTNQTAITIDLGLYGIEEPRGYFRTQRY